MSDTATQVETADAPPRKTFHDVTADDPCPYCKAVAGCRMADDFTAAACATNVSTDRPRMTGKDGREYTIYDDAREIARRRKVSAEKRVKAERLAEVRRFLSLLFPRGEGHVLEIRALDVRADYGAPFQAVGYFDDHDLAAKEVLRYDDRECAGIYVTLNPPNPDCFARGPNKIIDRAKKATTNDDIVRRRWLIIDCDPDRPSGVPATNEQLEATRATAARCKAMLTDRFGWPAPVEALSGNGFYLLYRIDLPNDHESAQLVSGVLKAISALMAQEEVATA